MDFGWTFSTYEFSNASYSEFIGLRETCCGSAAGVRNANSLLSLRMEPKPPSFLDNNIAVGLDIWILLLSNRAWWIDFLRAYGWSIDVFFVVDAKRFS